MKPERWVEVENLYNDIVDLGPAERDERLALIRDDDLRREVISLIQAGPLSPEIAAWLHQERGRLAQHGAPTGSVQDAMAGPGHFSRAFDSGDLLAGRYQIIEFLGRGGMGEVYEAADQDLGERIAIKAIRPEAGLDKEWSDRFRREVRLARRVTHPNVCRVFDLERHGLGERAITFLTMELVRGETLAACLQKTGRFGVEEALPIATQLCAALDAAHRAGIIHRDLKCGNVMLVGSGKQVRTVVTDFGTARRMDAAHTSLQTVTQQSAIVGTPAYMSPEQLEGKELTPASDIYSLGLILYEMVTGVRPFQAESHWAEAMVRLKEDPEPPISTVPDLSREWNLTILRCLERSPAKRFSSAAEVAQCLQGTTPVQRRRWRGRAMAGAGLVLLAASVAIAFQTRLFQPRLPSIKHIAVLPFKFDGEDPASQAMASELAESLSGNLSRLQKPDGSVWVVPWKTVRDRPAGDETHAGAALGANLLLTGEITRIGGGLLLRAKLVDASNLQELRSAVVQVSGEKMATLEDSLLAQASAMLQVELPPAMAHRTSADATTEPGAYEYYIQGRGYMLRREVTAMDQAVSLLQKAILRDSRFARAHADLCFAYGWKYGDTYDKHWLDLARKACDQALKINSQLAPAHVSMGRLQQYAGKLDQAIWEYEEALRLDSGYEEVRDLLSLAYDNAGKVLVAEALLKETLKRNPANWVAYDSLGYFYYVHASYTEAAAMYEHAAEFAPDNPLTLANLGGVYFALRRLDEAEEALRKSIKVRPTARAYTNLATVLGEQGRYADSANMLEKAIELTPDNHRLWYNLGNEYHELHDEARAAHAYAKAAELAEKELTVSPGKGELLERLATYYAVLGQKNKALHYQSQVTGAYAVAPQTLFDSAVVYQLAGKPELALKAIHDALVGGVPLNQIENTATFAGLRTDKRYLAIIKKRATGSAH